jgi:hypothetical protein
MNPTPTFAALWGYLFDKYHMDLALEGHVHYYMRSHPIFRDKPMDSPNEGTIHIISLPIASRKREFPPVDYAAVQFSGVPVYQLFEIEGRRLKYKVYDIDGNVLDEFSIDKDTSPASDGGKS